MDYRYYFLIRRILHDYLFNELKKRDKMRGLPYKVNFKDILNKLFVSFPNFVCLVKHIRRDFQLVAWVMPRGWTFGYRGGLGVETFFPKFNQIWCVSYLHVRHMQRQNVLGPRPLGPWGATKRSNIIKSQLQSQFQRFLKQTLCVISLMKDIEHI